MCTFMKWDFVWAYVSADALCGSLEPLPCVLERFDGVEFIFTDRISVFCNELIENKYLMYRVSLY